MRPRLVLLIYLRTTLKFTNTNKQISINADIGINKTSELQEEFASGSIGLEISITGAALVRREQST